MTTTRVHKKKNILGKTLKRIYINTLPTHSNNPKKEKLE